MKIIAYTKNGVPVFSHDEAHPHRMDLAEESIGMLTVPETPADPADRSQTRHCEVLDMGRVIGKNHLVETDEDDAVFFAKRDDRPYPSRMVLKETADETRLTVVLFYAEGKWILWTNYEGEDGLPEVGCDRYNNGTPEFQQKCREFWATHALVPNENEILIIV